MEGSGSAYSELLSAMQRDLPFLAAELQSEVESGVQIDATESGQVKRKTDRRFRTAENDITVRLYSDDERLRALLTALTTLARTMRESRSVLLAFMEQYDATSIQFLSLDDDGAGFDPREPNQNQAEQNLLLVEARVNDAIAGLNEFGDR